MNATNDRISALDDCNVKEVVTINFDPGSAVLTEQTKSRLIELGRELSKMKGYVIEVAGFGDKTGTSDRNTEISQRRADAVARYLVGNGLVSVRRLLMPFGYGTSEGAGHSAVGQAEIRILTNSGLVQPAPTMTPAPPL